MMIMLRRSSLLSQTGSKDFVVYCENNDHGYVSGDETLNSVAQIFICDQGGGQWIPHIGRKVHHQKYPDRGQQMYSDLRHQGPIAFGCEALPEHEKSFTQNGVLI